MRLLALLLLAVSARGQGFVSLKPPPPPEYKLPQYLLVTRYYSTACYSALTNQTRTRCDGWAYNYYTFESVADILKELNARGRYDSGADVVGVFRLDDKSEVKITSRKVQKVIPKHIEEEKWEETVWEAVPEKPKANP
jgi:serine protease inhibitor ecotin